MFTLSPPCSRLLCQLDTTTLQLLADNPRVQTLRPELATFFTEACQNSKSEVRGDESCIQECTLLMSSLVPDPQKGTGVRLSHMHIF